MKAIRQRDTDIEMAVRRALFADGLRYRIHLRLEGLRNVIDIAFVRYKIAILVDGCFWHFCPEHRSFPKTNAAWWLEKLTANAERDRRSHEALERRGWTVLRVWGHDNPHNVPLAVRALMNKETK